MSKQKKSQDEQPAHAPKLDQVEEQKAEERTSVGAHIIHEVIRKAAEEELRRTTSGLAWSGLAAGLSMGFSLVAEGLLQSHLPDAPWRPLISKLGYSVGFLIVIIGRQQLFTENTLTPIIPLLSRRDGKTLRQVMRLWGVVLVANLLGSFIFAWVAATSGVFSPELHQTFVEIGREASHWGFGTILLKGIFAGWLIALMVWMLGNSANSRVVVIVVITYIVGLGGFSHIIAGSAEVMFLVIAGGASWWLYFAGFMLPTLLGNVLGGISLVAALNHAQVIAGGGKKQED